MSKTVFTGDHQHLVAVLVEARHSAGLRQSDVAKRIGRDRTFVSLFENGQRRIDVIEFFKLAVAYGRDPRELFEKVADRIGGKVDPVIP